jgi:hypothetical protein
VRLLGGVLGDAEVFGFFDGVLDLNFDSDSVDENHPDDKDDGEGVGFFDGVLGSKFDPDSDNEGHPDDEDNVADEDDDDDEVSGAGRFRVALRGALGGVDGFAVRLLEGVLGDTAEVFGFFNGVLGSDLNSNPENEDHPDDEDNEVEEDDDDKEDDEEDDDDDEDDDDGEDEEDDDELSGADRFGAPLRGALGGVDMLIVRLL